MLVYRVEIVTKNTGPYSMLDWQSHDHNNSGRTPAPCEDPGLRRWDRESRDSRERYRFGFSSIEQLMEWFTEDELRALSKLEMTLSVYEIENRHTVSGYHQVVFKLHQAEFISASDLI